MSKKGQFVRVFNKHKHGAVWHWFDQMQPSERGKWKALCGTRMKVLDMTERGVEYVYGCSRCHAAHHRLTATK